MKNRVIYLILFALIACNPCKRIAKHPECFPVDSIVYIEKYIQSDSVENIASDSSFIRALFECDSNYNIVVKELHEQKSENYNIITSFSDGFFNVKTIKPETKVIHKVINKEVLKEVKVMNPINAGLKREKENLQEDLNKAITKLSKKQKIITWLIISLIISIIGNVLLVKFK